MTVFREVTRPDDEEAILAIVGDVFSDAKLDADKDMEPAILRSA